MIKKWINNLTFVQNLKQNLNPDDQAAQSCREKELYEPWVSPCPLLAPWKETAFSDLYQTIFPYTVVSPDRCYLLRAFASHASRLAGDFAECGVYKGGTAYLLAQLLSGKNKKLYLFDSFEGLPAANPGHDNYYKKGDFASSQETAEKLLQPFKHHVRIHKGWLPATFSGLESECFAFVHMDMDFYESTLHGCDFFYPRLVLGGMMLFDDYGFPACRGEKEALDKFFKDRPESPIVLPSGQALVIKL